LQEEEVAEQVLIAHGVFTFLCPDLTSACEGIRANSFNVRRMRDRDVDRLIIAARLESFRLVGVGTEFVEAVV
jgi:hypothetical protein